MRVGHGHVQKAGRSQGECCVSITMIGEANIFIQGTQRSRILVCLTRTFTGICIHIRDFVIVACTR